ncbi:MAG: hypothetical protein JO017_03355, partial [Actinobacteria bacterium]|nr:hypothetical protein [Actinomycetota bacterium]
MERLRVRGRSKLVVFAFAVVAAIIAVVVVESGSGTSHPAAVPATASVRTTRVAKSARPTCKTTYQPLVIDAHCYGTTAVTPNWSGYVASAPGRTRLAYKHPYFTHVTGTWTVPRTKCSRKQGATSSTVWVGLGGYTTRNQEEVGTDSNCTAAGKSQYYAWFELVPYLSYQTFPNIKDRVLAGDTVTGWVTVLSPRLVDLKLVNHTRGWTFEKKIDFASQDTSTADWVVEAPADCVRFTCHEASLANFGKVTMHDISAVGRGVSGNLASTR